MSYKAIYKYELPIQDEVDIPMPRGAQVLVSAAVQHDALCVWAVVDTGIDESENRRFYIHGTGHPLNGNEGRHLGTVLLHGGTLVLHVFEYFRNAT